MRTMRFTYGMLHWSCMRVCYIIITTYALHSVVYGDDAPRTYEIFMYAGTLCVP